ncbi:MAG: response regulator [Planctomycetota bacterium]
MQPPLRILHLEDSPNDAELIQARLAGDGVAFEAVTVATRAQYLGALEGGGFDIIFSDYSLPDFDGLSALKLAQEHCPNVPVIIVSGAIGEDLAAELLRDGARDYVLKDRLARLAPALQRVLREAEEHAKREEAERKLWIKDAAIASSINGIILADLDGRITYANKAALAMSGYTEAEVVGLDLVPLAQDRKRGEEAQTELRRVGCWVGEMAARKKDGGILHVNLSGNLVYGADNKPLCLMFSFQDITAHRKLERQLQQIEKLESIGKLAGGVAHDFNNILSVVLGYSQMALQKMTLDDPLRKKFEAVLRAGERGAALARQLLIFSCKQAVEPHVISLNAVVTDFDKMLRRLIGEDIKVTLALAPDAGCIRADAGQIEQVIMNLCVNARDAMPRGGELFIKTANVTLDEAYARVHPGVGLGPHVMLAVNDTGSGMSSDVVMHIFEPFFTTKEPGKGTGLGLSVVYGIVKQFGGSIAVYSELGHGTVFKVYFPCLDSTAQTSGLRKAVAVPEAHGETVLVVDDEADIRSLVQETLQDLGYTVLVGAGPQDALHLAETHTGPLHLLLTDVVMPEMSGKELAERVKAKHPQAKVLFMSGYTHNVMLDHGVDGKTPAFVEKPFMPAALATKVREVLGG